MELGWYRRGVFHKHGGPSGPFSATCNGAWIPLYKIPAKSIAGLEGHQLPPLVRAFFAANSKYLWLELVWSLDVGAWSFSGAPLTEFQIPLARAWSLVFAWQL